MTLFEIQKLIDEIRRQLAVLQVKVAQMGGEKRTVPNLPNPEYILVHHAAGNLSFEEVNELHKQKWGFRSSLGYYIGYQYFIDYDGTIYQGRRDREEGAHTVDPSKPGYYNKRGIGICLRGNFETMISTILQTSALKKLIEKKQAEYAILDIRVLAHREVTNTLCPGKNLWNWFLFNFRV